MRIPRRRVTYIPHSGVGLGQADEGLQLSGVGGDGAPPTANLPHVHVGLDEQLAGFLREHRVHVGAAVGYVVPQRRHVLGSGGRGGV